MHITVTGASGHIGNNIVRYLVSKSIKVRAVYHTASKDFIFKGLQIEHRVGDILDKNFVEDICKETNVVIHLAAIISIDGDPTGIVHLTNTLGVRNVTDACRRQGVKKLIHFSSIHAFNLRNYLHVIDENCVAADASSMAYDFSKAQGEKEIINAIQEGLDAYILHPTAVIGPHDYFNSYSGIMLRTLFLGRLPALLQGGFDWVDVRDVCKLVASLIDLSANPDRNTNSRRYIVSGHFADLMEIAESCSKISLRKRPKLIISKQLAIIGLPFVRLIARITGSVPIYTQEAIHSLFDQPILFSHERAKLAFGYKPRDLSTTLHDCFVWYKENNFI